MGKIMITTAIAAMALTLSATPVFAATPAGTISENKAKQIAITDAGVAEGDITFTKVHLDTDDGRLEYEIEFVKGTEEFDYDIDAASGTIVARDQEIEDDYVLPAKTEKKATKKSQINENDALDIALKDAGVSKKNISYSTVEADFDDGAEEFDVEFHVGNKEYSYTIAKKDGRIIEHEAEIDD